MRKWSGVGLMLSLLGVLSACTTPGLPPDTVSSPALQARPATAAAEVPADDAEMVSIPAGEFTMGEDVPFDTRPARRVSLPAFWIDTGEVTNTRYKRFIDATGHKVPWSPDPAVQPYAWDWQLRMYPSGKANDPVALVSWEDAKAFCTWAGKTLPSEAQWEKAARGLKGNLYPWGNAWLPGKANTFESGARGTAASGAFEGDVSEFGVRDLAGNVSEWVEEWFAPYPGNPIISYEARDTYKVLRGGSWDYFKSIATGYHRQYALPHSQMAAIGFRCVKADDESAGSAPPPARPR